MSIGQFFNYQNFSEKKIQLKRPIIREINCEKYFFVPIRFRNKEIYVKTPKIKVPFGLNIFTTDNNEIYYYYVLSFTDADIDPNIENFNNFLKKIELFCQNIVKNNLDKWGCDYQFENLNFKSCFKDNDGDPLFRLKITPNGKQATEIYNEKGELQNITDIELYVTENCQIISLIELNNIWIKSSEYGLTWKVRQIRTYPSNRPIGGVSLLDENIGIHTFKIIEKECLIEVQKKTSVPPPPPPPPPPLKSKIPIGGVTMLPFLSVINSGVFQLKKVDQSEINNKKSISCAENDRPAISLDEILKIKNGLKKKQSDNPPSD